MTNKLSITSRVSGIAPGCGALQTLRAVCIASAVLLLLLSCLTSSAQSTNAASRFDYSFFRIINDRNIFNSRRSARYVPRERTSRSVTPRTTDSFALVGTMSYDEKGPLAFFDGSSSEYRKVLKPNETIAGFTVAEIASSHVKLASPTNQLELRVGMQLRHDGDGTWQVTERSETAAPASTNSSRSSSRAGTNRPAFGVARAGDPFPTNAIAAEIQQLIEGALPPGSTEPQEPAAVPDPSAAPAGSANDVLERLRQRAAAERGEN